MGVQATPRVQLQSRRAALISANARDPRAAGALFTGTVAATESCEFYGLADAISRCRKPRSCHDCLATTGCGLTDAGYCVNATRDLSSLTRSPDYRSANFSNASLVSTTSAFSFLADSATYCAASDSVCIKCREQFERDNANADFRRPADTQFCKGEIGCVCIAVCEVSKRREERVMDWNCDQPHIDVDLWPPISRVNRTKARSDPRGPMGKVTPPPKTRETCAYTKDVDLRGCRRPRSCQSCLEKTGCTIVMGQCYDMTQYSWDRDFRQATLDATNKSGAVSYAFPSSNTTYCPSSDATCAACRETFQEHKDDGWTHLMSNFDAFCVGQDGCVCIAACESNAWTTGVYDRDCDRVGSNDANYGPASVLAIAAVTWLVLVATYKLWWVKQRSRNQERRRFNHRQRQTLWRNMLDEVPALPILDLFGWRAYRQGLFHREQELLQGRSPRPLHLHVDFNPTGPSAPDLDEDSASAPTAQDPKALASAPVYRSSFHADDGSTDESDHSCPSAPDFEEEELQHQTGDSVTSQDERLGLVTRRARREEYNA